jgi:glutaminyl-tRNA synthetase
LGFDWAQELYTSDYFAQLYEFALTLIKKDLAYVDDSTAEEIAAGKGTPTVPGTPSVYRSRSIEENLQLFEEMKAGNYQDGAKVLRAKIDFAAPNMHLRDPLMYRIKHANHHRTGDAWCICPCTILPMGKAMPLNKLPILFVLWSLFRTVPYTIGLLKN